MKTDRELLELAARPKRGKPCPECGEPLVSLSGPNLRICSGCKKETPWPFNAGERVAQLVVVPCYHGACVEVGSLEETMRGDGAYGPTGA